MRHRNRGISLIEALVAILVFSTGMLGLAQLQSRLWQASGELHEFSAAYLACVSELEQSLAEADTGPGSAAAVTRDAVARTTTLHIRSRTSSLAGRLAADVELAWDSRGGPRLIRLTTARYIAAPPFDARWLLPSD